MHSVLITQWGLPKEIRHFSCRRTLEDNLKNNPLMLLSNDQINELYQNNCVAISNERELWLFWGEIIE